MTAEARTQTTDAVEHVNRVVDEASRQATTAIVFQEIAQSMAVAVQSGVDHLQGAFSLNIATTGTAIAQAITDAQRLEELRAVLETSQASVAAAISDLARLVTETARAMQQLATTVHGPAAATPPTGPAQEKKKR